MRLERIYNSVKKCNQAGFGCSKEKLMNVLVAEMGLRYITAKEHIETLQNTGQLELDEAGDLWITEKVMQEGLNVLSLKPADVVESRKEEA